MDLTTEAVPTQRSWQAGEIIFQPQHWGLVVDDLARGKQCLLSQWRGALILNHVDGMVPLRPILDSVANFASFQINDCKPRA